MKTDLLILTSSPFDKRDYDRFGIEILARHFSVRVLDCTPWVAPHSWEKDSETRYLFPGYSAVGDGNAFRNQIADLSNTVAIDYLGSRTCAAIRNIRQELQRRNSLRAIVRLGLIPMPQAGGLARVRAAFRHGNLVKVVLDKLDREIRSNVASGLRADIAVLSGEAGLRDLHAHTRHQVWAHSFDYDIYLKLRGEAGKRTGTYAVFLDEDMVHNSYYHYLDLPIPVTEKAYYNALNSFFGELERITGLRTVIAAHPRSRYDMRPQLLAGREVVLGKTAELVRDASLIFVHSSTSISFAVLWRKPMVFLTTDELQSSYWAPHIAIRSKLFHAPLVNINDLGRLNIDLKAWLSIDESAYADYSRTYIKRPGTPDRPLWEIFSEYVRQNLN